MVELTPKSNVLIIIPAYNESESIEAVVDEVIATGFDYVVVNDGSKDDTAAICRARGYNLINLRDNLGIGGAVQVGHKYALKNNYDIDIQFDGDGQHKTEHLNELVKAVDDGADLVLGSRFIEKTDGFKSTLMRRLGIKWISLFIRIFGRAKVTDPTSGYRACGRATIKLFSEDYPIDYPEPESIVEALKQELTIKEIPVTMNERTGGKSSIRALSSVYYMIKVSLAIAILGLSPRKAKS